MSFQRRHTAHLTTQSLTNIYKNGGNPWQLNANLKVSTSQPVAPCGPAQHQEIPIAVAFCQLRSCSLYINLHIDPLLSKMCCRTALRPESRSTQITGELIYGPRRRWFIWTNRRVLQDFPLDGHGTGGQQRALCGHWCSVRQWQPKERLLQVNQHRVQQVKLAVRTGTVRTAQTLSPRLRLAKIFELWRR